MRCHTCGEPWDLDSIHDEIAFLHADELEDARERWRDHPQRYRMGDPFQDWYEKTLFNPAIAQFRKEGCKFFGSQCEGTLDKGTQGLLYALDDMLGDDVDGIEAMIEDMGL